MENEMAQFYAIQLQDANKTIQTLCNENNHLREEIAHVWVGDTIQYHKLQEKFTNQKNVNSSSQKEM